MTEIFKLLGTIAIDASQAHSEMDNTTEKTRVFSENVNKYFNKIVATAATVFSAKAIKDFAKSCVDAYAEIAAEESAFSQVMGDYAENAQYKLEAVAEKTGVISSRLTPYMTSLTAKFKGLGYGVDEATTLAAEGLTLAADAAAFSNMSLDEAMSHFNSFINGSYEGGEAIQLFANDTQMAMWAVEKGLVSTQQEWSKLDEATKQSARMQYAQEAYGSMGISGQSLLEAGSYQNQMQNLEELWERFKAVIGEPILENVVLPIVTKLTEFLQWCQDNPEVLEKVFGALGEAVGSFAEDTFDGAITFFKWIIENEGALTGVLSAIGLAFAGVAIATHPILSALAGITAFVLWLSGSSAEQREYDAQKVAAFEEEYAGIKEDYAAAATPAGVILADDKKDSQEYWEMEQEAEASGNSDYLYENAGKYAHWSDVQKAYGVAYAKALEIGYDDMAQKSLEFLSGTGLNPDDINSYTTDVANLLNKGDYSLVIEETWFDETAESQLQEQCDNMNLKTTVSLVPDYSAVQTYVDSGGTAAPGYNVPGAATGLDRVPYDNYLVRLHKDEAVLNATNAAAWRSGSMGDTSRLEGLMQQLLGAMDQLIANTGRGQTVVLDSGALVGQMLPAIDSGLGAFASRKGRRNG